MQINDALAKEDRLGVSLGGEGIVYGALTPNGTVAWKLKVADQFLGAIAFNKQTYIAEYKMAPGYDPTLDPVQNLAVYFNIHDARFEQEASGELKRSAIKMSFTVVPLTPAIGVAGSRQPDLDEIARGNVAPKTAARLQHLEDNFGYYGRERIISQALAYGEAAAFVRAMKAKGIRLNLRR